MAVKSTARGDRRLIEELERRGWWFEGPNGAWVHYHVQNHDGTLLPFGIEELCKFLNIDIDEYAQQD
jgi:hypothetical protein